MTGLPPLERRTLGAAFDRVLDARPDEEAQAGEDGRYTFAQVHDRSLLIAGGTARLGVGRGDVLALMLDNHLDSIHTWFGLSLTGGVEVPINTAYKGEFLTHILNDCGATVLVCEERYCERIAMVLDDLRHLQTVVVRGGTGEALAGTRLRRLEFAELLDGPAAARVDVRPDELMAYMYTSGTTGASKGVELTHAHGYTYSSREDAERPHRRDRILVTLPTFHLAAQGFGIYQALVAQAFAYLAPGFSVSGFWPLVRRERITMTTMLGAISELLQQQAPGPDDADNPLELAIMAPLASDIDAFRSRFGVGLIPVYGMSEIGCVMTSAPEDTIPGEAGSSRGNYDLRLVDEDGRDVPDGTVGQLIVRPHVPHTVLAAYHNLPEKTADTVRDGWVHTGDAFTRDADGHYRFVDRIKDALRRRGENISSFELEAAINQFPDVYESAVVGVPSPEFNEDEVKAVVVVREGAQADPVELTRFLIDRVPYFMVPRFLEFVPELPKTPTMKVRKAELRDEGVHDRVWDREAAGITVTRHS
ncbi:AMP-binding protein [Pseudonocardia abyssalis]|uniref:AMP-binding protein n=1 Tax=Pseudonocardia abyssalis TaxID=2792008 RepID=A0ABS6UR73_9PSEU|nr:AMP-binding protein [Pseudonocardia abyssalis]MBW0134755.1 AMP-binding protein [Pseudonocardia abyssalis]